MGSINLQSVAQNRIGRNDKYIANAGSGPIKFKKSYQEEILREKNNKEVKIEIPIQ